MRVLILTKIFPNAVEPDSSPFNRQQFAALARTCELDVVATIPWFPGAGLLAPWSRSGRLTDVPRTERIDGLSVAHPRYAYLPKLGLRIAGPLYAISLAPHVISKRDRIDVVLGSWAYPDGFAAVMLAKRLGVPAVVKVHGTDINVLALRSAAGARMRESLPRAERIVAVSRALADAVAHLGVERDRIDVVPNGVDTELFQPRDRGASRRELGLATTRPSVLFVGRIERSKGVLDLIRAFARPRLSQAELWMVGDGTARPACERLARDLGVSLTIRGSVPHPKVADYLAACNVLALPSLAEGCPNVVLEALACGRRVVATSVGGIPEIIASDEVGELVPPSNPDALATALERGLSERDDPKIDACYAHVKSWTESAAALHQSLLTAVVARSRRAA